MTSFNQASPPTPCAQLYPRPYAPNALPISFVSILLPAQYWVRSTDHSAPRFLDCLQKRLEPSGYYMYHHFNIHDSTFRPRSVFVCFVWVWEQTAIIPLYSIKRLIFITENESVYCAVQTEPSQIISPSSPHKHVTLSLPLPPCSSLPSKLPLHLSFIQQQAVPWLRWLLTGLSPQRLGSIPGQSMWDFLWTKWHWDMFFCQ